MVPLPNPFLPPLAGACYDNDRELLSRGELPYWIDKQLTQTLPVSDNIESITVGDTLLLDVWLGGYPNDDRAELVTLKYAFVEAYRDDDIQPDLEQSND